MIWLVIFLIAISCLPVSSDCMLDSIKLINQTRGSASTADEEAINDLNSFRKLYMSLKEYHENELNKLKSKYDLLEEQFIASEKINTQLSNSQTKDLQQKVEKMYEKLSRISDTKPSAPITCPTNQFDKMKRNKRIRGNYVGCFQDREDHRGLKGFVRQSKSNSIESCIEICRDGHYVYAGVQSSTWCLCDNTMQTTQNVLLVENRCNSPCSGNSSQRCGGAYVNSIYETGVEQYLIDEDGHQSDSYISPSPYSYWINVKGGKMHN